MKKTKKSTRPTNVLDIFIILVIVSVIVGYTLVFINKNFSLDGKDPVKMNEYEMSITVENSKIEDLSLYSEEVKLVIKNENTVLGSVVSSEFDENKNEIKLKLKVVGTYTKASGFKLNGNKCLAPGDKVELESQDNTIIITEVK